MQKRRLWNQFGNGAAHRIGAKKQCFLQTSCPQQPVCKHMSPLRISTELNFVNRQKVTAHALGHRLDSAHPILRARWHDPFLAGNQSHHRRPAHCNDPIIDLTRQKPQGQANDTSPVSQHALDCIMGFTGIGWAQNRDGP